MFHNDTVLSDISQTQSNKRTQRAAKRKTDENEVQETMMNESNPADALAEDKRMVGAGV